MIRFSEKDWESYFSNEFSAPDPNTSNPFANRLESVLSSQCVPDFVVTYGSVHEAILKLKKKHSRGVDELCALNLLHGTTMLIEYLTLLSQIIFTTGIVPDSFCVGLLSPILKKGKPTDNALRTGQSLLLQCSVKSQKKFIFMPNA